DISMGRMMDGSPNLSFFPTPTPGSSNNTEAFAGLTFYEPHFSVRGGFYDAPFEVIISTIGETIRYTTDGSLPTLASPEYIMPLIISETTNLRARIFQPDFIAGKPVTQTYFFDQNFEERGLPVISITTDSAYFWNENIGLYVQDFKPEWEYPINIELFENDGSDRAAFNELAGTKVNGLNSWVLPQKMLGIYFDNEYDNNKLEYPLFFDRERVAYDNLILRASGSDWSETLFRDGLCQGLTAENMDLEKTGFRPLIVYVNGQYLGIHNLRSRTNESFIEENFGYGNNEYDLIENEGVIEEGDAVAFNEWFALCAEDLTDVANFQAVSEVMDVQNFTDFFITEIWTSNSSWGHNVKTWKPKAAGTKWRWILQDFDRGFSGATDNGIDYFSTSNNPGGYNWARVPLKNMLGNEDYALQFASRFTDHLYTTFHPETVTKAIAEKQTAIEKEIPNHVNRWAGTMSNYGDGLPSVAFWENEVNKLGTFAYSRQSFLLDDLQNTFDLDDPARLGIINFPADVGHVEINNLKIPASNWEGFYFKNLPFELNAIAGVGHEFSGWSLATYDTLIEKSTIWGFLDDGSNQGTAWQELDFNDGAWVTGQAELGYGDGDENTIVSFGGNANDKHPTTYFRKKFTIDNLADYSGQVVVNLLRDDGAAVYLNGIEIIRSNIPSGDIAFDTYATDFTAAPEESSFLSFLIQTDQLLAGENVVAVEVHQANATSSDISFNLEMKALKVAQFSFFSTEELLSVNMTSDTFLVAHFLPMSNCILPREITENTTLTIDCSPYFAPDDVTVLDSINLVIEAGVAVHFPKNVSLFIKGNLQVDGTEAAPVVFKAIDGVEKWGNLNFQFSTDTSRLNWLEIIDASEGDHPINDNAAITAFYAKVEMNHVKIEEVFGNPIFAQYSDIYLINSQLHSKITGDLINVKYGKGYIDNCDFKGNNQIDTDAIDYDEVENGVIRNSKIYDFLGFNSDGIDLGEESSDVLIENNFIYNCTDKAISVGQLSTVFAQNNTIVNCYQGFGIKDLSTAEIDQHTFFNTAIPVACFEKNIGIGGGMAFLTNSILSNAPEIPVFIDENSSLTISNTLTDTEEIGGADNVFAHPYFVNPTQSNFQLQANSNALDAGMDDFGNVIDLGSKYHDFSAPASIQISAINYHPIDGESEFLKIYNPSFETINLTGYNFSKAIDYTFPVVEIAPNETIWLVKDATLFPDVTEQIYTWFAGKLSNGGESIRLSNSNAIIVDQVVYDDELPWFPETDGQGGWLSLISPDLDNHFAKSWAVEGLVAVEELADLPFEITIFPNPTHDFVRIHSADILIEKVAVFNLLGQSVAEFDFEKLEEISFSVNGLPVGVYVLKINEERVGEELVVF
ncbi:MAG: hypothetical protein ACI920_002343, partial [Saprospiraceae bacterium]